MNIGVVLNYFRYFLHFPSYDPGSSYTFITSKEKYTSEHIPALHYVNWRQYITGSRKAMGDVDTIFKPSVKLGLIPKKVDLDQLCAFYENSFEHYLKQQNIDLLISGGVSGFERAGIATAQRMGIKTLCVWEGMFRPFTISADPLGMNAESSVAGTPWSCITGHSCSHAFDSLWMNIINRGRQPVQGTQELTVILGDRFKLRQQLKNRIQDRHDIERIRLPFHQLAASRISYYAFRQTYASMDAVTAPFIFFPLQTHTDSNILLNSQYGSTDAYLQLVLAAFELFHEHTGINLLIKEHPLDLFRKSYQRNNGHGVYWVHPAISLSTIVQQTNCLGTLVINSTSGLESLIQRKPVLCLGKALYAYPELVEIPETGEKRSLFRSLNNLVERNIDSTLVKQLCGFLYDKTQVDGNIDSTPGEDEVLRCSDSLRNRLRQ